MIQKLKRIKSKFRYYFIKRKRYLFKKILDNFSLLDKTFADTGFKSNINNDFINEEFESLSKDFVQNRWAYIENPIKDKYYKNILLSWPSALFFNPRKPDNDIKIQDTGFKWGINISQKMINKNLKYINSFPGFKGFYEYLKSKQFCEKVRNIINIDEEVCCYYISSRVSSGGSYLDFHMDGAGLEKLNRNKAINIVWHINGINGSRNGGLCLATKENVVDIWPEGLLHESKQLKNSCFIYDTSHDLGYYHGYPPMNKNSFRWVITSQFLPKNLI